MVRVAVALFENVTGCVKAPMRSGGWLGMILECAFKTTCTSKLKLRKVTGVSAP